MSCKEKGVVFEENLAISQQGWKINQEANFSFDITDTTALYEFYFNIRNTASYPYANFHLYYKQVNPDATETSKRAEFILAEPSGKWLGKTASGTLIDNSILFIKQKLPQAGKYTFYFKHGMYDSVLNEVTDIGLKVKKANP